MNDVSYAVSSGRREARKLWFEVTILVVIVVAESVCLSVYASGVLNTTTPLYAAMNVGDNPVVTLMLVVPIVVFILLAVLLVWRIGFCLRRLSRMKSLRL